MRLQRVGLPALVFTVLAAVLHAPASAQQSTLMGTVTDLELGTPVPQAVVRLLGDAGTQALTNNAGRYMFQIPAGTYSLVLEVVGYRQERFDGVRVAAGEATTFDISLESLAFALDPLVVTTGRTQLGEKSTEAPATSVSISSVASSRSES